MPIDWRKVIRELGTGPRTATLEERLFRRLCLLVGSLLLFVVVPLDASLGLSRWLEASAVVVGIAMFMLNWLAAHGRMLPRTFLFLVVTTLNIGWFTEGGVEGAIGYFFFAVVVFTVIFFRGVQRTVFLVLFVVDGLALIVVDYLHPAWSVDYASPRDRVLDLTSGFVVSTVGLAMMIWLLRSAYDLERRRQMELNRRLSDALEANQRHVDELAASLAEVRTLRGLLPICSNCKSVRDDAGLWTQIEQYVSDHSDASFTHSLCPDCLRRLYPELAEAVLEKIKTAAP
ncbi:MAG: hypothetical protein HY059_06450 [Proteobacteria bacterium]|nr:hypothetical protein [Pseudomonadota bacterium]